MSSILGKKILYVWKGSWPWDIRIDKICTSLGKAGAEVRILAKQNPGESTLEEYENYSVARDPIHKFQHLTIPAPNNLFWKRAIQKQATIFQPDLIIVREIMLATQSAEVAKSLGVPVIMDMAENYPALMRLWKKYRHGFINQLLYHKLGVAEWAERKSVTLMDGIIVVCSEQIERLQATYGFEADKIKVVHNTPISSIVSEISEKFSKKDERIVFCHHGYLTEEKKIDNFLKAFLELANHKEKFRFIIAGDGESLPELKEIHENHGSPENIVFLGEYNHFDLPEIIGNCDYGVLPYNPNDFNNYTIHNKIFDYFAFKKPVIVSNAVPLERIVNESGAGKSYDFTTQDSFVQLLNDVQSFDYKEMSDKAFTAFRDKYNWENDATVMVNFIEKYFK